MAWYTRLPLDLKDCIDDFSKHAVFSPPRKMKGPVHVKVKDFLGLSIVSEPVATTFFKFIKLYNCAVGMLSPQTRIKHYHGTVLGNNKK